MAGNDNKKYVELLWYQKYDRIDLGEKLPIELWNIGNYETVYWQERQDEYLAFMLKLYQAQPLTGFRHIHGRKGCRK